MLDSASDHQSSVEAGVVPGGAAPTPGRRHRRQVAHPEVGKIAVIIVIVLHRQCVVISDPQVQTIRSCVGFPGSDAGEGVGDLRGDVATTALLLDTRSSGTAHVHFERLCWRTAARGCMWRLQFGFDGSGLHGDVCNCLQFNVIGNAAILGGIQVHDELKYEQ